MSVLLELLSRYDDDAWAALANRGLLRRARKDLGQLTVGPAEWDGESVRVPVGDVTVSMGPDGPSHAVCTCPSTSVCQHVVAAGLWLVEVAGPAPSAGGVTDGASLLAELLALDDAALERHAGRAGWRWARERAADLELDEVRLSGDRMLVVELERPRVTYRYAGGGLTGLVADAQPTQPARAEALVVLAVRRAHGAPVPAPDPVAQGAGEMVSLQAKVRASVRGLLVDTVALGVAHLSADVETRYTSAATSAQGAEYHRLARLLRRMADRVQEIRARDAGADSAALVGEAAVGLALVEALETGRSERLLGRPRASYDEVREMELVGLGGQVWSSRTGFRGLTTVFWWPARGRFCSWTDTRPQTVPFDPVARWTQPGPWSGVQSPSAMAGASVRLRSVQLAGGRLSSRESTQALVTAMDGAALASAVPVVDDFSEVFDRPAAAVLDVPDPLRDWVVLRPAVFGPPDYDPLVQRVTWPVADANGLVLPVQVTWTPTTASLVETVERRAREPLEPGTLLVARVHRAGGSIAAEPLSLIRPDGPDPVDCLHLGGPPTAAGPSERTDGLDEETAALPGALVDLRLWLLRTAERGTGSADGPLLAELAGLTRAARQVGFSVFGEPTSDPCAVQVLRTLAVLRQVELVLAGAG